MQYQVRRGENKSVLVDGKPTMMVRNTYLPTPWLNRLPFEMVAMIITELDDSTAIRLASLDRRAAELVEKRGLVNCLSHPKPSGKCKNENHNRVYMDSDRLRAVRRSNRVVSMMMMAMNELRDDVVHKQMIREENWMMCEMDEVDYDTNISVL